MKTMYFTLLVIVAAIVTFTRAFDPVVVNCEVNGFMIPAVIDTGAEISVMSSACARRCKLTEAIDPQHSGRAVGVGTSEIIGGIEGLGIRIGPLSFQNKISVLRNSNHGCDFIIGLDILHRFRCDVLLRERVLRMNVRGNEVRIPFHQRSRTTADLNHHYQTATTVKFHSEKRTMHHPAEPASEVYENEVTEEVVGRRVEEFVVNRNSFQGNDRKSALETRGGSQRSSFPELEKYQELSSSSSSREVDEDDTANEFDYGDEYDGDFKLNDHTVSMEGV